MARKPVRPVPRPRWLFARSPDSLGILDRAANLGAQPRIVLRTQS